MNRLNSKPVIDIGPVDIPISCLPESATQDQIGRYLTGTAEAFGHFPPPLTIFFNVVGDRSTSDRAFIVTLDESVRDAIIRDLNTVRSRDLSPSGFKHLKLDADPKTSFGSIFEQLEAVEISLFGLSCPHPKSDRFLFAHFFICGTDTIADLKKEMHWARFTEVDAKPSQNFSDN